MTNHPSTLLILGRDEAPPLTDAAAWKLFPEGEFDLVIIDSLDSAAEGVGEQDSAKPSRAIAAMLDVARKEGGPAFLILGNTIRSANHSRGSGVVEDRADIVYEVRDATGFQPSGGKPWIEELPPAGASDWKARSGRRKERDKYRLAFIATKFRVGQEPEPFILEIDHGSRPWTLTDVTDAVDREGVDARKAREEKQRQRLHDVAMALAEMVSVRCEAGNPMKRRTDAEPFLTAKGLTRSEARGLLDSKEGTLWRTQELQNEQGKPKVLNPLSGSLGHNLNPAKTGPGKALQPASPDKPAISGPAKTTSVRTPANIDDYEVESIGRLSKVAE